MATKIAINGFGRTGRMFFRAALHHSDLELVAVNDLTDAATLAHLLKHDSVHGALKYETKVEGDSIFVAGRAIQVLNEHDPAKLPWRRLGVKLPSSPAAGSGHATRPRSISWPGLAKSSSARPAMGPK